MLKNEITESLFNLTETSYTIVNYNNTKRKIKLKQKNNDIDTKSKVVSL